MIAKYADGEKRPFNPACSPHNATKTKRHGLSSPGKGPHAGIHEVVEELLTVTLERGGNMFWAKKEVASLQGEMVALRVRLAETEQKKQEHQGGRCDRMRV